MRAREFIVEYKRDITMKNWYDKILRQQMVDKTYTTHAQNEIRDWLEKRARGELTQLEQELLDQSVEMIVRQFESADPSPNKQYVQWMLRIWTNPNGVGRIEDVTSTTAEMLHKYHELKQRNRLPIDIRDINQVKDMRTLEKLHDDVDRLYALLDKDKIAAMPKGSAREVYNGPDFRLIVPEDEAAACYYGQGTRWCTAATKGHNMFDHYSKAGPIYILIPKKPEYEGEKYQLHGASRQSMDERDQPYYIGNLLGRFPELKEILFSTDDFYSWVEIMPDAFVEDGVATWNAYAAKHFKEWGLTQVLTGWTRTAKNRGEIVDVQKTSEKVRKVLLDLLKNSQVSITDFYDTATQIHAKGETAATNASYEFAKILSRAWRYNLIATLRSGYTGKNAKVSLERPEWDIAVRVLDSEAGVWEDSTAEWSNDEGWEFSINDPKDPRYDEDF